MDAFENRVDPPNDLFNREAMVIRLTIAFWGSHG
jgi:hypothetical protein